MSAELVEKYYQVTDLMIAGFFRDHRWLSNFHLCPVTVEGITYPSSEHAYMAQKTTNGMIREELSRIKEPKDVKKAGQLVPLRDNWDEYRIIAMTKVLYAKFTQNEDLKQLLLETEDKLLYEVNWWNDLFWGMNLEGKGKSMLGECLMLVRSMLR